MRAVVVRKYGGPEALEIIETPAPTPAAGEIRVAVQAAAVNPIDAITREGAFVAMTGPRDVIGLGWDVAGTVDAVGPDVTGFVVGDRVIAVLDRIAVDTGAYADQVVLAAAAAALVPTSVDLMTAATLPLNALTAAQALDLLELPGGATVLITGAAGAVGEYAVALGRARGLRVIATASATDEQSVRAAGADEFIARTGDLGAAVHQIFPAGVDGLVDAAQIGADALAAVRDGGVFVAVTDPSRPEPVRDIDVRKLSMHHDGARLSELVRAVDEGRLTLRVAATFPLDQVVQAHQLLAKGGLRGRIVLIP